MLTQIGQIGKDKKMIEKEILARVQGMSKPAQNDPEIMDVFHKENVAPELLKKIGIKKEDKKNEI
jgi:hypothetical protein